MASGSQMCSGNMALLPAPPTNISPSASGIIVPAAASALRLGREGEGPGVIAVDEDTDEETQVGEARDDEGLLRGSHGLLLRIVEADQQVGADAHQLPEEVHLEDVGRHDQPDHAHREERQKGVVTLEALLTLHVAQRVDVDHERHRGDHHEHHHRDRVEQNAQVDVQRTADGQPHGVPGDQRRKHARGIAPGREVFESRPIAQQRHDGQHGRAHGARRRGTHFHARKPQHEETRQRKQQNQNRIFHRRSFFRTVTTSFPAGSGRRCCGCCGRY